MLKWSGVLEWIIHVKMDDLGVRVNYLSVSVDDPCV